MFQESFMDAEYIVENIINSPLSEEELTGDLTRLNEAIGFNESGVPSSYLSQIMENFIIYPRATETLVHELDLLYEDPPSSF